ncbi:hypothetical protein EV360DRAFT_86636 [Lentinula raphanica]|nr:hypothetical protein EV360DRAFT_86636 [Lentinula raphanica]
MARLTPCNILLVDCFVPQRSPSGTFCGRTQRTEFSPRRQTMHSRSMCSSNNNLDRELSPKPQRHATSDAVVVAVDPVDASTHGLPPRPSAPIELPTTDPLIERLEKKCITSRRLFDEQEAIIKFTEQHIEILTEEYDDVKEILRLKRFMEKLDHTCLSCNELAWNPHM